jgi:hypothetical protein
MKMILGINLNTQQKEKGLIHRYSNYIIYINLGAKYIKGYPKYIKYCTLLKLKFPSGVNHWIDSFILPPNRYKLDNW